MCLGHPFSSEMLDDQNADDRNIHHHSEVSSSTRTTAVTITPTRLTSPNHRKYRRLEISAGPHVTAMYGSPMRASFGVCVV